MQSGRMNGQQHADIDVAQHLPWSATVADISPGARLTFAKQVLGCLAIICIGIMVAYGLDPDNSALQAMFELVKIGALPIVTLMVSFYFPIRK